MPLFHNLAGLTRDLGPTFRYQPDSVLFNTPSAYQHKFGPKVNVKKGLYYDAWPLHAKALTTWNTTDIAIHTRKRRVLNYAFSNKALRSVEPFVPGEEWSGSLNMTDWTNWLVFDILGDLCFGKSSDMKKPNSSMRQAPALMVDMLQLMHPVHWLLRLAAPPAPAKWNAFVGNCLTDRTRTEEETQRLASQDLEFEVRKDFFRYLFHAKDPETGKGFPIEELWGEAESLIIAGSDTTAVVMAAMLAREVLSRLASAQEIESGPALQSCSDLRVGVRRVLKGGTVVDSDFFPEGVNVQAERWIAGDTSSGATEESVALAESAFCAFSTGTRGCPGNNLTWLEMSIVMAKIIYSFEIRRDEASNLGGGDPSGKAGRRNVDQYQTYDAFVSLRVGPLVQLRRRQHS
ncbi:cytochrome P450 [Cryphonectria parasitica EP155]|uniref:Cytochrome P450 n=1 Tax=Cryphonectria parasitica (strain ATCC 38755 / EP155) TaxID=660469 RepID=A0A9P4YCF5_CRYP1|nr:cytochrome P450 [Cryphonectria parasitica EP155]KAF3770322.1 cytochrome P450 [Cryphonectria parasitica EP155]